MQTADNYRGCDTPVVLIGGGGQALSLLAANTGANICGYVDRHIVDTMPLPYLGTDDEFIAKNEDCLIHISMVSGDNADLSARHRLITRYRNKLAATLVAETAVLTQGTDLAEGCAVMARAVINNAVIGRHCIINTGAIIEHQVHVGDNVFIGPGAVICGNVTIGADTYVGAGVTIRNNVSIVSGAIIGMGAVVISDITEPGVYVGCPARLLRSV